jgi:hypothetical protein
MVNWTVVGLVADMVGAVILGFIVPRHRDETLDGGSRARDWWGKLGPAGWTVLLLGFLGQLVGAL